MSGVVSTGRLTIAGFRAQLAKVDGPGFRQELSQLCGEAAGKFVNDGFRNSVDPYGTPWEALKSRKGKPLLDTGRLRASFAVQALPNGFRIDATAAYAPFHQYGTGPRVRRARFQPIGKGGRFASRRKFSKQKRGSVQVRFLPGGTDGGIVARPMVPTPEQGGLPFKWQKAFGQVARDLIKQTMAVAP